MSKPSQLAQVRSAIVPPERRRSPSHCIAIAIGTPEVLDDPNARIVYVVTTTTEARRFAACLIAQCDEADDESGPTDALD